MLSLKYDLKLLIAPKIQYQSGCRSVTLNIEHNVLEYCLKYGLLHNYIFSWDLH